MATSSRQSAASTTLAWEPLRNALLSKTLRYVSRQYEDDLETDALPGAVTIDGYARFAVTGMLSIVGRVENLFDKNVVTRNAAGSIDLGTPRTLWIGLRITG